jgi:hypothetical protein
MGSIHRKEHQWPPKRNLLHKAHSGTWRKANMWTLIKKAPNQKLWASVRFGEQEQVMRSMKRTILLPLKNAKGMYLKCSGHRHVM